MTETEAYRLIVRLSALRRTIYEPDEGTSAHEQLAARVELDAAIAALPDLETLDKIAAENAAARVAAARAEGRKPGAWEMTTQYRLLARLVRLWREDDLGTPAPT